MRRSGRGARHIWFARTRVWWLGHIWQAGLPARRVVRHAILPDEDAPDQGKPGERVGSMPAAYVCTGYPHTRRVGVVQPRRSGDRSGLRGLKKLSTQRAAAVQTKSGRAAGCGSIPHVTQAWGLGTDACCDRSVLGSPVREICTPCSDRADGVTCRSYRTHRGSRNGSHKRIQLQRLLGPSVEVSRMLGREHAESRRAWPKPLSRRF
jgi:hypothetical protein